MLDKWIITDKELSINNSKKFRYTICWLDYPTTIQGSINDIKTIYSFDNFNIGDLVDSNLKPLEQQYAKLDTDIMIVQSTCFLPFKKSKTILSKLSLFDPICGDCCAFKTIDGDEEPHLERGGMLWADCSKNENGTYSYNLLENVCGIDPYELGYEDMPYMHKIVITGLNLYSLEGEKIKKHLLAYSENNDCYASFCIPQDKTEYYSEIGDKLLVEKKFTENGNPTFNILQNISVDYMRKCVMR